MKYSIKDGRSFGTFGISFSDQSYDLMIDLFDCDNNNNTNLYPLDNYYRFIQTNETLINQCLNIHPTLILPDVTKSSLREARDEMDYIKEHTTDGNIEHFSKYWTLRFNPLFDIFNVTIKK